MDNCHGLRPIETQKFQPPFETLRPADVSRVSVAFLRLLSLAMETKSVYVLSVLQEKGVLTRLLEDGKMSHIEFQFF